MNRQRRAPFALTAIAIAALAVAACGEVTEPPADGLLADLDALGLRTTLVERANVVQASAGASRVFWAALRSIDARFTATPDGTTIPEEHYGQTFVFSEDSHEWEVDPARTGAPADGIRVVWYALTAGGTIALPLIERGYIDLVDLPDGDDARLGVTVYRANVSQVVAEYVLELHETDTAQAWNARLDVDGGVAFGERDLDVALQFDGSENRTTGDESYRYDFALTQPGFSYAFQVERDVNDDAGTLAEAVDITLIIDGVETRLQLDGGVAPGGGYFTGGPLHHGGEHIADVALSGTGLGFTHPDGSAVGTTDRQRLETVVLILIDALGIVNNFFG